MMRVPPSWAMVSRIDTPPWMAGMHQFPHWKLKPAVRSGAKPSKASASKVRSEGTLYVNWMSSGFPDPFTRIA